DRRFDCETPFRRRRPVGRGEREAEVRVARYAGLDHDLLSRRENAARARVARDVAARGFAGAAGVEEIRDDALVTAGGEEEEDRERDEGERSGGGEALHRM